MMADHPPAWTLDELTHEIQQLSRRWLQDYITIGNRLKQVKAMLTHGAWLNWLERDAPFSVSTAERCMRADDLAQVHPELADPSARIEVSAIDLLTAKQTPATVVTRVIKVARQGTLISQQYVQAELDKRRRPRPAPRKSSTVENLTPAPAPVADLADKMFDDVPLDAFDWPPKAPTAPAPTRWLLVELEPALSTSSHAEALMTLLRARFGVRRVDGFASPTAIIQALEDREVFHEP